MAKMFLDDDSSDNSTKATTVSSSNDEPGWFEPGSKSEAAVRGFAQGATLGLAPKISAYLSPGDTNANLAAYLAANRAAAEANPKTSMASNLIGSLPSTLVAGAGSIPAMVAKGAGMSAVDTYGNSQKEGVELAKDVGQGAVIGGALSGALPVATSAVRTVTNLVRGVPNKEKIAEAAVKFKNSTLPPTKGITPGSANPAFADLRNTSVGNRQNITSEAKDALIMHDPVGAMSPKTMETVIKSKNAETRAAAFDRILENSLKGAGIGGASGYVLSGGDMDKALAGAAAGAVGGAAPAGISGHTGNNVKLRMPGSYEIPNLPSSLQPAVTLAAQAGAKDIKEVADTSHSPFGSIVDYLKLAQNTSNPQVQAAAQQAQAVSTDPDSKRKAGMALQSTPEGRAVTNSESSSRFLD